jgi:hypothetical protein
LVLTRLVTRGQRQEQVSRTYQIPHCPRCARSTNALFLAGCIPFVLGLLLVGIATFVVVAFGASALGLDDYGQPRNNNSLVLGAGVGLLAGLVVGFVFEVVARVVLLPLFGTALLRAPLLTTQIMSDADYVVGLSGKLDVTASFLQLTFANDDIAREFQSLNAAVLLPHASQ